MTDAYECARGVLTRHKPQLHLLAQALLDRETLTGEQLKAGIVGEKVSIADPGGHTMSATSKVAKDTAKDAAAPTPSLVAKAAAASTHAKKASAAS